MKIFQPKICDSKNPLFDNATDQRELLCGILSVLKLILTYDHGEFLDEQTANDLVPLIINLMENVQLPEYKGFCTEYLVSIFSKNNSI